jgi:hypothetical protein
MTYLAKFEKEKKKRFEEENCVHAWTEDSKNEAAGREKGSALRGERKPQDRRGVFIGAKR